MKQATNTRTDYTIGKLHKWQMYKNVTLHEQTRESHFSLKIVLLSNVLITTLPCNKGKEGSIRYKNIYIIVVSHPNLAVHRVSLVINRIAQKRT